MMKKISLLLVVLGLSQGITAQVKQEIGATVNAEMGFYMGVLYNTNWTYKAGSDRGAFRVRLNKTQGGFQRYQDQNYLYLNTGVYAGYEFRKKMLNHPKMSFMHGPELGSTFNTSTNYANVNPSFRYFLGLRYQWLPNLSVSLEMPSSIGSNFYRSDGVWQDNVVINAGILNESSLISVLYCW